MGGEREGRKEGEKEEERSGRGKRGDREFDMRIRELAVAGESVSGSGACP